MAVASSVNAAQAIVGLAISSHGSHSADRVAVPAGGFALSSLAGRSLTCSRSPRFQQQRRWPRQAYNPKNPYWFNRDRFVLSAGHGCMLQYALLHLAGYDSVLILMIRVMVFFPSLHSLSFYDRVLIDAGPLGQGIANAVGLALAERHLAARFNKPDNEIVDHYT
ncbi:hypothetical protein BHE74_00032246 [Ensete ventricosum]|nr:hypothetical protein BHE74_00032246 [Ensete ventricosum]